MTPSVPRQAGRAGPALGSASLLLALLLPVSARSQVIPDTLPPLRDTTVVEPGDTLGVTPDTVPAGDTLPAVQLPGLVRPTPPGWHTGVWEWDRDQILGSRALTLAELVAEVPGVIFLRGGDFGTPVSVSAFGAGGGQIRVFRDELEVLPLEGSVPDLTRIGLAGLRSVRVVRSTNGIRIELTSILAEGGRAYSLVEAGTGDLNTNLFRGTFSHPRAFGGVLALGIDRVDTQGYQGKEPGSGTGGWIRYARPLGGPGSLVVDFSRSGADRGSLYDPSKASRTDWSVRTRWSLLPGLVGDLYYASGSLRTEEGDTFPFGTGRRTQTGGLLSFDSPFLRALGRVQRLTGEGLPGSSASLEAQAALGPFGGLGGELEWESWEERSVSRTRLRAWTAPVRGLSLFAELGSGEWGLPYLPDRVDRSPGEEAGEGEAPAPPDTVPSPVPGPRFSEGNGLRYGAHLQWRALALSGARLKVEADSLFPLGLATDREGLTLPGGTREGFELSARVPLYPQGMALVGSFQWWDQAEDVWAAPADSTADLVPLAGGEVPWRYLPRRSYEGSLSFHDAFLPTENLEVWFDLGVKGRDPMVVPFPAVGEAGGVGEGVQAMVPFYQSWFLRLQIRVVTVRVFFKWENLTIRERNQDLPGRLLPATRSVYGVRWTMWN